jgi:hypothetical protein
MEKVTQTELVPVESTNIAAVGYDGGTLTVAFMEAASTATMASRPRCTTTSSTPSAKAATCTAASGAPAPSNGWRWTDVPA